MYLETRNLAVVELQVLKVAGNELSEDPVEDLLCYDLVSSYDYTICLTRLHVREYLQKRRRKTRPASVVFFDKTAYLIQN